MTSEQISDLRDRAYQMIEDAGFGVSEKTMATTSDTLADFIAVWGEGKQDRDLSTVRHRVWRDIQKNGKGTERGTLVVLDFGDIRVASFC